LLLASQSLPLLDLVYVLATVIPVAVLGVLGVLAFRYRTGGFWRETAEERGARIKELEESHGREVGRLNERVAELERKNHDQAVRIAQLEERPNMDGLYELLKQHDDRAADAFAAFQKETREITAALHGITVLLGKLAENGGTT
jgi:hypothetical protein